MCGIKDNLGPRWASHLGPKVGFQSKVLADGHHRNPGVEEAIPLELQAVG